jgi:hypothetical protein
MSYDLGSGLSMNHDDNRSMWHAEYIQPFPVFYYTNYLLCHSDALITSLGSAQIMLPNCYN